MFFRQKSGFLPDIHQRPASTNTWLVEKVKPPDFSCPEDEKSRTITVSDAARFRNPHHQNLCVSMLQEGFHLSFEKLFSLLKSSRSFRLAAEQSGEFLQELPLEDQHHKLEALRELLTRAEAAERSDQNEKVYDHYLALAKFFSEPEDVWLQQNFYQLCLFSSRKIKTDLGKREAEARAHLGQLHMEQGELDLALEHYERYHQLVTGQLWQDKGGRSYRSRSYEGLCRVYTLLAEKHLQINECRHAVEVLTKAYSIAKEGDDKRMEGEAAYRIAVEYQSMSDHTTAKQFLNRFMEISTALEDSDSVGRAYKAFAKSLKSDGKLNESLQYLQKYAEISEECDQEPNLLDACMCLGSIHSSRAEYGSAWVWFIRAGLAGCRLGSVPVVLRAQAGAGAARALSLQREFSALIAARTSQSLHTLLHWTDTHHEFLTPHDETE